MFWSDFLVSLAIFGLVPLGVLIGIGGLRKGVFAVPIYWMAAFPCLACSYFLKHGWYALDVVMAVIVWLVGALVITAIAHLQFDQAETPS